MVVSIWGDIAVQGRYEVKRGTDLVELLFLAGGPGKSVLSTRETRETLVRVMRKEADRWQIVFEAPLNDILSAERVYPPVQDQDILQLETTVRPKFGWRDALTLITPIVSIGLLIERISRR